MSTIRIEGPLEDVLRRARQIEEFKNATDLSEETKAFLIDKAAKDMRPRCPTCGNKVVFAKLAQTPEIRASGHLGWWCRDCEGGIETDLKWLTP